jgi:threonine dehydrogenase-like Zn-dependent dehydrogenase
MSNLPEKFTMEGYVPCGVCAACRADDPFACSGIMSKKERAKFVARVYDWLSKR